MFLLEKLLPLRAIIGKEKSLRMRKCVYNEKCAQHFCSIFARDFQ